MAKERMINTKFWSDSFVIELNSLDRYLFLYLLTNEHTNICGVYELPLKRMSDETGIEKEMLLSMLKRLESKISYVDGWVSINNFIKHQKKNPKVKRGIELALELVPDKIRNRLFIDYDRLPYSNTNSNSNPNSKIPERSSEIPIKKEEKKDVPFVLEEYLEKMKVDKNNHVRLISYFITRKEINPSTVAEVGEIIRRNAKTAKRIADTYSKGKIAKAFDICIEKHSDIDWGLETVYKKLTNSNL